MGHLKLFDAKLLGSEPGDIRRGGLDVHFIKLPVPKPRPILEKLFPLAGELINQVRLRHFLRTSHYSR